MFTIWLFSTAVSATAVLVQSVHGEQKLHPKENSRLPTGRYTLDRPLVDVPCPSGKFSIAHWAVLWAVGNTIGIHFLLSILVMGNVPPSKNDKSLIMMLSHEIETAKFQFQIAINFKCKY